MSCDTEHLKKQLLIFLGNVVFIVLFCVQLFWWFSHKPSEKCWAIWPKAKHKISKKTMSMLQKGLFERCSAFFFGCTYRKLFWELTRISLLGTIRVFWANAESRFGCASFRRIGSVLCLFTTCVWDVLWYRTLIKKQLLFLEQNRNFPKRRWLRSKNIILSSARLNSLVVNKKAVLRTWWDLSTWNNTCFLFKCRVTFRLRYFSNATFGTLARYILRLRSLGIPKT